MPNDIKPLSGDIGQRDNKGHNIYQCFLCDNQNTIFSFNWYGCSSTCVCHGCMLDLVNKAVAEKRQANIESAKVDFARPYDGPDGIFTDYTG